jgi:hypothetical protein
MPGRPKPYLSNRRPWRWSGIVWLAGLLVTTLIPRDPELRWARVAAAILSLGYLAEGVDALRTGRAELRFNLYWFVATRWERPVRFWVFALFNLGVGMLVGALALWNID